MDTITGPLKPEDRPVSFMQWASHHAPLAIICSYLACILVSFLPELAVWVLIGLPAVIVSKFIGQPYHDRRPCNICQSYNEPYDFEAAVRHRRELRFYHWDGGWFMIGVVLVAIATTFIPHIPAWLHLLSLDIMLLTLCYEEFAIWIHRRYNRWCRQSREFTKR